MFNKHIMKVMTKTLKRYLKFWVYKHYSTCDKMLLLSTFWGALFSRHSSERSKQEVLKNIFGKVPWKENGDEEYIVLRNNFFHSGFISI